MAKVCQNCGTKIGFREKTYNYGEHFDICNSCNQQFLDKDIEERKQNRRLFADVNFPPKIKCPYCGQWFEKPAMEQYRDSAERNVIKWVIVPAWGLAGSLKNKPFIECPHCNMKLMQG
jgi:DNA-directed RNA polymerase subunit RPC12/RpoP